MAEYRDVARHFDVKESYIEDLTCFRLRPEPNKLETVYCGVCRSKMDVKRSLKDFLSYSDSLAKIKTSFDEFLCPNYDKIWHRQVVALRLELCTQPSQTLRKMLLAEIDEILSNRKSTIEESVLKEILIRIRH